MATTAWLGAALKVPQQDTILLTLTWAAADTIDLTINGKVLTLTCGSGVIADIIEDLANMINGGTLANSGSANALGSSIGEFNKLTATEDGVATVTITGPPDGQPFTLTVASTTAGDGAHTHTANFVTPTGPHHWDDADNWSGGAAPSDADVVVFDGRATQSLKYALDQNATTPSQVIITQDFGPNLTIGLPEVNKDTSNLPHDEYLQSYLKIGAAADAQTITVDIDAKQAGLIKLDTNTAKTVMTVTYTGSRASPDTPVLLWKGTHIDNEVNISRGDMAIAFYDGETAVLDYIRQSYVTNQNSDSKVIVGDGTTLNISVDKSGGELYTYAAVPVITHNGGSWTHYAGNITTATIMSGVFYFEGSGTTITTLAVYGGTVDGSRDNRARTVTNCSITKGGGWMNPADAIAVTNGIDLYGCTQKDLSVWEVTPHLTWTSSTI
jgi:hypothetical protein